MSNISVFSGSGDIAVEPDWKTVYKNKADLAAACEHWRVIRQELADAGTLAAANGHMIQRLVHARVLYDKCVRSITKRGAGIVIEPKKDSPRAIARLNPYWAALRDTSADADRMEAELGLSPRRRGAVTKVQRKQRTATAADAYLSAKAK